MINAGELDITFPVSIDDNHGSFMKGLKPLFLRLSFANKDS